MSDHSKGQIQDSATRMVLEVAGKIFQEKFTEPHGPHSNSEETHNVLAGNWLTPNSDLRDLEFGVILSAEQIDVRHVLLADSHPAPIWSAATLPIFYFSISIFVFRSKRISHGYVI
jgi:hypothetical protein